MAKVEVNWSGEYPILCMGEWTLKIDGNDATHLIPEKLRHSEMNTKHTDNYDEWRKNYPECSAWVSQFPYQIRLMIYIKIKEKDFIRHTCGGCL